MVAGAGEQKEKNMQLEESRAGESTLVESSQYEDLGKTKTTAGSSDQPEAGQ